MITAILILFFFQAKASGEPIGSGATADESQRCAGFLADGASGRLVEQLTVKFDLAYATSGFPDPSALIDAAKSQGDSYRQAVNMLENEEFDVAIATRADQRDQYMTGFRNYYESESSAGAVSTNRDLIESAFLHMNYDDYVKLPPHEKVIYAYLAPNPGTNLASPLGIHGYGKDHWILKLKNVSSRTTLFIGDSLNYLAPTTGYNDNQVSMPLDDWTQHFIPWSRRQIIAPLLAQGMSQGRVGLPVKMLVGTEKQIIKPATSPYFQPFPLGDATGGAAIQWIQNHNRMIPIKSGPLKKFKCDHGWGLDYFELQILGGVDVSDILAFEYTEIPPSGEFLRWLQSMKIEIRDGRSSTRK